MKKSYSILILFFFIISISLSCYRKRSTCKESIEDNSKNECFNFNISLFLEVNESSEKKNEIINNCLLSYVLAEQRKKVCDERNSYFND